jgi:hypothetical protein
MPWIYVVEWKQSSKCSQLWRWLSSGLLHHVVLQKFTNVSGVLNASIIRVLSKLRVKRQVIGAGPRGHISLLTFRCGHTNCPDDGDGKHLWNVNFYRTIQHSNPEVSHLHIHHCENLKSQIVNLSTRWKQLLVFIAQETGYVCMLA